MATTIFDAGKLKPKYLFKKLLNFVKIQNIHSKIILILFKKIRIFIQNRYQFFFNLEYSYKKSFMSLKSTIFIKNIDFFKKRQYCPP